MLPPFEHKIHRFVSRCRFFYFNISEEDGETHGRYSHQTYYKDNESRRLVTQNNSKIMFVTSKSTTNAFEYERYYNVLKNVSIHNIRLFKRYVGIRYLKWLFSCSLSISFFTSRSRLNQFKYFLMCFFLFLVERFHRRTPLKYHENKYQSTEGFPSQLVIECAFVADGISQLMQFSPKRFPLPKVRTNYRYRENHIHYSAYDPFYIIVYNENPRCVAGVIKYYSVVDSQRIKWNFQSNYQKQTDKDGMIHRKSWFPIDSSKLTPNVAKNQMKIGLKIQAKFMASYSSTLSVRNWNYLSFSCSFIGQI